MTQEEYSQVCPYLGLADDADSHATYATEAHRCYRLESPTRIALPHQETYCLGANHVTCPVYQGQGIPSRPVPAAPAAPPPSAGAVPGPRGQAGRAPFGGRSGGTAPRRPARQPAGTLGPRPRPGGVSLPVATIGLFALALVVLVMAFAIQQIVDDDGNSTISPADAVATRDALNRTQTAQAASGTPTPPTQQAGTTGTPGAGSTGTPATTRTPAAGTPTPGGNGRTYTVAEGDTCFSIAQANGVTLEELLQANNLTEDDCTRLAVGQTLRLP
ncbi:LysM peptidoglycan-binding domain-containing protein [Tepidiforma sp.]|uniref:LysM peptidoglycan-binding domain-containing protein n=1 Tax=Tepidiforma sp. TaxID=2682230 RepID=UPI002ADE8BCD|nr:LysM peptidoglycan-binding domain-containing protein [Tepidiforma sp.]